MLFSKNPGGALEPLAYRAVWYDGAVLNSVLNIYKVKFKFMKRDNCHSQDLINNR